MSVRTGSASPALSNAACRCARDARPSPSRIRAVSASRSCVISDMLFLASGFGNNRGACSERFEEATPVARLVEDLSHLVAACPVAVEPPMLELDTRLVCALGDEAHLDFRLQVRVVLPIGGD